MKKILLYTTGLMLGAALVACDDYKEPNPPAQSNTAPEVLQPTDVSVANELNQAVYELAALETEGQNLVLANISSEKLQEGYEFTAYAYISNDNSTYYPITTTTVKNDELNVWQVEVSPTELSDVYHENISWDNDEAEIQVRYQIATSYNGQVAMLGDKETYFGPYTFKIIPLEVDLHFYYLYTPGDANGWSQSASQLLSTTNFVNYTGYAYLSTEGFKFTSADNWDGINFGAGEEEGTLSTDPEAGNLTVEETGLYWCDVNVENLTYTLTLITTYGLIGDATEGQWDYSIPMTPSDDFLVWTITTELTEGQIKFRANDGWDINLGGNDSEEPSEAYDDLVQGGKNLLIPAAGTYEIVLNLSSLPYSCTITAK